ncbi:MAG: hypothetical protein ACNA77_07095 [Opitutales bacterium]
MPKEKKIVVDASVVLAVILDEPEKPALVAETVGATLLAPGCLSREVGNAFSAILKRKRMDCVLDTASREGKVLIRKRDGSLFALVPEPNPKSAFDVVGISTDIKTSEILETIREERGRNRVGDTRPDITSHTTCRADSQPD